MIPTLISIWLIHVAVMLIPGANVLLITQLAASDRTRSAVFCGTGRDAGHSGSACAPPKPAAALLPTALRQR